MQADGQPGGFVSSDVARRLKGDIPCVSCGYNLRQLSVLEVCPECGTPVRATVLAVVDPYASVLQPVRFKRLVAVGLLVWAGSALAAALLTWALRVVDMYAVLSGAEVRFPGLGRAGVVLIVASSLGAMVLIRPHGKVPVWQALCASAGVVVSLGAAWMFWRIQVVHDPFHVRPFVEATIVQPSRAWMRLMMGAMLIAAVLLLRPAARMLAARSLVMRMGRVDRQTMLAIAVAAGLAAVGDLSRLAAFQIGEPWTTALNTVGIVLIAVGSMLVTLGLVGVLIDCARIARVIVRPPAALSEVIGDGA